MAQKKAVLIYFAEEAWYPAETNRFTPRTDIIVVESESDGQHV